MQVGLTNGHVTVLDYVQGVQQQVTGRLLLIVNLKCNIYMSPVPEVKSYIVVYVSVTRTP